MNDSPSLLNISKTCLTDHLLTFWGPETRLSCAVFSIWDLDKDPTLASARLCLLTAAEVDNVQQVTALVCVNSWPLCLYPLTSVQALVQTAQKAALKGVFDSGVCSVDSKIG